MHLFILSIKTRLWEKGYIMEFFKVKNQQREREFHFRNQEYISHLGKVGQWFFFQILTNKIYFLSNILKKKKGISEKEMFLRIEYVLSIFASNQSGTHIHILNTLLCRLFTHRPDWSSMRPRSLGPRRNCRRGEVPRSPGHWTPLPAARCLCPFVEPASSPDLVPPHKAHLSRALSLRATDQDCS